MAESVQEVSEKIKHKRMTIQISGHVQGVGFRYFIRKIAVGMPLAGFVRNDADGTVTVVAEATEAVLNSFLASVSEGPDEADVEDVEVTWSMAFGGFEGFVVKLW